VHEPRNWRDGDEPRKKGGAEKKGCSLKTIIERSKYKRRLFLHPKNKKSKQNEKMEKQKIPAWIPATYSPMTLSAALRKELKVRYVAARAKNILQFFFRIFEWPYPAKTLALTPPPRRRPSPSPSPTRDYSASNILVFASIFLLSCPLF